MNHNDSEQSFNLCKNCHAHLTSVDIKIANKSSHTWPSFVWFFLTDSDIKVHYNSMFLWKFIPQLWRHWWIRSYSYTIDNNEEANNIDIHLPIPFLVDRTNDIKEWNVMVESMVLPNICKACNKYLIPNVLCPYGFSTFIHRHGCISFYLLLQHYVQKQIIQKLYSNRKGL